MDFLGDAMLAGAEAIAVVMLVTWLVSLVTRDVSWVDVSWGLAFVAAMFWAYFGGGGGDKYRGALAILLVALWGGRLAGFIGLRKLREGEEDHRYARMRQRNPRWFPLIALPKIFLLQGVLAWIIALPLFGIAAGTDGTPGPLHWLALVFWAVGIVFETIGDQQNAAFRADPANKGTVNDRGLWRYTRHPNYFGDFMVWWGLYLLALDAGAWWSLPGPLIMSFLLIRGTGKGMTEKHMSSRAGYADYVERTSGFIPLPPRKPRAAAP